MRERRWEVWLAAALLLAAVLAVLGGLLRLSQPDPAQADLALSYTAADSHGWTFETEDGPAEPVLHEFGYLLGVPAETAGPLAATRTMEDTGELNLLQFTYFDVGIQVFLDGRLLHTDFPGMDNRPDVFLEDVDTEGIARNPLYVTLPDGCAGQELRVVTYGPAWDGYRQPVTPVLTGRFTDAVLWTADAVRYVAAVTVLALLALFLLLMFLLGAQEGRRQWNLLPLAAYFLLAAVPVALAGNVSVAAGLDVTEPPLHWIKLSYVDFLMAFLAMELRGWKRWLLLAGSAVHALLSLIWVGWGVPGIFFDVETNAVGLGLLALAAALMALQWREKAVFRWGLAGLCAAAGAMFAACWAASFAGGPAWLCVLANPIEALGEGDPRRFYTILCAVAGVLSAAWVAGEFVRGTLERRRREQALRMNQQLTQESYQAAAEKLRQNALMRHEWKNQVAVMQMLQQQGDLAGLGRYLEELDGRLDKLAPRQYTEHFVINTILQNTAARAEALGVDFRATALAPPELGIDTGDLCSLLLNLLDNALEAAAKVPAPGPREVECVIKVRQGYLAVRCGNTCAAPPQLDERGQMQTTKDDRDGHGFGLAQMRAIAAKYGSVLDVSCADGRVTVLTALKIP